MPIQRVLTSQRVPVKIWTDDVYEKSTEQLANIASMPFIHHHVAAMPDVHVGMGATIGSVIATHEAIKGAIGAHHYGAEVWFPESFCSSAHGAGRRMSRTAAEKQFTAGDLAQQRQGVICRKDKGVIDEIPGAYKDIDQVMANQNDLTEILHTLKQVVCVKG